MWAPHGRRSHCLSIAIYTIFVALKLRLKGYKKASPSLSTPLLLIIKIREVVLALPYMVLDSDKEDYILI